MASNFASFHRLTQRHGPTPEFVRWSIDRRCSVREPIDSTVPARVERFLRPLTAIGACLRAGRVFEGICLASPDSPGAPIRGCRLDEVADFYGGLAACQAACSPCAANIEFDESDGCTIRGLAGCHGWLVREETAVARLNFLADDQPLGSTSPSDMCPAWYKLGAETKLSGDRLERLGQCWDRLADEFALPPDWRRFGAAVRICRAKGLALSVDLVPAGRTSGTEWTIGPYCPACRAAQAISSGGCAVCGRRGHPHPAVRRKVLGQRPFLLLDGLVGPERARDLIGRLQTNDAARIERSEPPAKT